MGFAHKHKSYALTGQDANEIKAIRTESARNRDRPVSVWNPITDSGSTIRGSNNQRQPFVFLAGRELAHAMRVIRPWKALPYILKKFRG